MELIEEDYLVHQQKTDSDLAGHLNTPFMYNDPGAFINPKQNHMWKPVVAAVNGMACGGVFYQLGLVSRGRPAGRADRTGPVGGAGHRLRPVHAVQGTVRAICMAHELARREALARVSSFVALGTQYDDIAEGQARFQEQRIEWRLR